MSDDNSLVPFMPPAMLLQLYRAGIRTMRQVRQPDEELLALLGGDEAFLKEVRFYLALYDAHAAQRHSRPSVPPLEARWEAYEKLLQPDPAQAPAREKGPEREQVILVLHLEGKTPRQIGLAAGLSRQRVYVYLARLGVQPNRGKHPAIVAAHQRGQTPREIADTLRISLRSVYRCLNAQGYTPHQAAPIPRPSIREAVLERHRQGLAPREIAEALGVSMQTVYAHLRRSGG